MIGHRNLCNLVAAQRRSWPLGPESRVLQFASFSFDGCTFEVFLALAHGASLHLSEQPGVIAGDDLARTAARAGITHAVFPPAVLAAMPEDELLPSIHTLVLAGEAPSPDLMNRWARGRRLMNGYGPTEATVGAANQDYHPGSTTPPPIGRPMANVRVYLLDGAGEPVPRGATGELYIGGRGVGRGYRGRPDLTAERFVPDPFGGEPGARLYRTGDLGRWNADAALEFAGRVDEQVKVRGFRIELGEIEARLLEHAGVEEAVVMARQDGPGAKRLVGYWVGEAIEPEALRAHLLERLPDYMVPAAYVRLDALPLTPNGKVDRGALPAPEDDAFARRGYEAPVGEVEEALAGIWAEVLGLERVGRHDGFFELGGHSLLAVTLIGRMRAQGLLADVRTLFATSTLAEFAAAIGSAPEEVEVPANLIPETPTRPADPDAERVEVFL
jgi:acyl-coenzyme A synthetase/AMP-(fatty) acid ligase